MAITEVGFQQFAISCVIGDLPEEREKEQIIHLTVSWKCDTEKVAVSDRLKDAIDYTAVAKVCADVAKEGKYQMLEALAEGMAEKVLELFPIQYLDLKIEKKSAFFAGATAFVCVKKERAE